MTSKNDGTVRYDTVLKDVFQSVQPGLMGDLTGGVATRESLNVEFSFGQERRADLVLRLEDRRVFHLEFQSDNDNDMPYREGIYGLLIGQKYRTGVLQVVLYCGLARMRMKSKLSLGKINVEYRLIEISGV